MFTGNEVGQRTVRITKAADDGYDADIVNSGGKRSEFIDIDLNIKRNVDGNQFVSSDYSWPLTIGRKWNSVTW